MKRRCLFMLLHLSSYSDYILFVFNNSHLVDNLESSLMDRYFFDAFFKMVHLRVDDIIHLLRPLYSHTGRPASYQMEIFRSFILMAHFNFVSIKEWVRFLNRNPIIALLCGFLPSAIPAASNHYDFISRIFGNYFAYNILPKNKNHKPSSSVKKGEKLDIRPKNAVQSAIDFYLSGNSDDSRPELTLQKIFNEIAVKFSADSSLIDNTDSCIISGDGSAFHIFSNVSGNRICQCTNKCDCHRHYSDPEADIGWDSDLGLFYFGYTEYNISYHNPNLSVDLPLFLTLEKASAHDSITCISSLENFSRINNYLNISHYCLDSASDNTATHNYLIDKGIIPVIDTYRKQKKSDSITLSKNGFPICDGGHEMIYWGVIKKSYRHKFRCPLALGRINHCSCSDECKKSDYGHTLYISSKDNPRFFGPLPHGSKKWKDIYNNRTSCERMNNRILNNYKLHQCRMHTRPRLLFLMMMIGINIHLDAYLKVH